MYFFLISPFSFFPIETISYGVQDLIYTRIFAMITVKELIQKTNEISPFECHAFLCDSKQSARKLTYSLALAFQKYSRQARSPAATNLKTSEKTGILLKCKDFETSSIC